MTPDDIKKMLLEGDEEGRRSAVDALAGLRGNEAMELILSALGDQSWRVRKTAEEALEGFLGDEGLVPSLISALRSGENAGLRNSAAAVLVRVGGPAVPYLKEAINDPDRDIRKFAADILGEIGGGTSASTLIGALRDPDDNVRSAAAEALGKIGGSEVINALVSILTCTEDDLWLRFSALEALGKIGKGIPLEPIVRLLEDRLLRKAAFDALGKSGDPKALPHLVKGFRDKGRGSREAAVCNFMQIYNAIPAADRGAVDEDVKANGDSRMLSELLDSSSLQVKKGAVVALGIMGSGADPARLIGIASDERMQEAVTEALVRMGDTGLEALINAFPKSEERMKAYICKVLGVMSGEKAEKTLITALSDSYGHTRQSAALSIAELGYIRALPFLIPLLVDEYEDVEEAAVKAIVKIGKENPGEVIKRLQDGMTAREPRLRRNITAILGGIGEAGALNAITSSLKDEEREVRKAAVSALGNLMIEEGIDHLALALADEDSQVRLAVAHALSRFRNKESERLLSLASRDEDVWVRCAALKGLSRIGSDNAVEILSSSIMDVAGVVAITAIDSLFTMKGSAAAEAIKRGLKHRDPEVIRAAEKTLGKIN